MNPPADAIQGFDLSELEKVREAKPWQSNPRYFTRVCVSSTAAMKMMHHAVSGVEKGMASSGGKPVEVMGLMLGRPSVADKTSFIVTDVFPLPIEGAETRVVADDQAVMNYMIELGENLEGTRENERFMGWYHSHPFDVEVHSHCFLSTTDITTQLSWQRNEDPHGNPWLAIVVDPLRSLAKGRPELGAFRVYPPDYTAPLPNVVPDGKTVTDAAARVDRWGVAWNRYYALEVSIYSSGVALNVLTTIAHKHLWKSVLSTTSTHDAEHRDRFPERVNKATEKLERSDLHMQDMFARRGGPGSSAPSTEGRGRAPPPVAGGGEASEESLLEVVARAAIEISAEESQGSAALIAKKVLFG